MNDQNKKNDNQQGFVTPMSNAMSQFNAMSQPSQFNEQQLRNNGSKKGKTVMIIVGVVVIVSIILLGILFLM